MLFLLKNITRIFGILCGKVNPGVFDDDHILDLNILQQVFPVFQVA
jgi:hypothetical protein